ncbi:TadE family type IV pilus minor pilin [Leifsonia sp. AG29]|uniref:TadE family type IV pilus minor pilin n=1 Tax=Leifsonia sp. AG29 TaxID=2598860 RepID=UPI00131BE46D|nr:TadE family type IV pilus minor pilin [Leifsonia sp. AG29]
MTAEFAIALPAVLACLVLCLAGVQAVARQLQLVDAAATVARLVALGEAIPAGVVRGSASLSTDVADGLVCVRLSEPASVTGAVRLGFDLSARACALDERPAP